MVENNWKPNNEEYKFKFDSLNSRKTKRNRNILPEETHYFKILSLPWTWERYFRYSMLKCMSSLSFLHFPMGNLYFPIKKFALVLLKDLYLVFLNCFLSK